MISQPLKFSVLCLLILSVMQGTPRAEGLSWRTLSKEVEKEITLSEERTSRVFGQIEKERSALLEEIATLEKRAGALRSEVEGLKSEFEALRKNEEEFRKDLSEQQGEVAEIHRQILSWQDDFAGLFDRNPLVMYHGGLKDLRDRLNEPDYVVTMEDIRSLAEALFTEITLGGLVEKVELPIYGDDGQERNVTALRVGTFCIFALSSDDVRLVRLGPGNSFLLSGYPLPAEISRTVKNFLDKNGGPVPVDITGKKAYENVYEATGNRLVEWFKSGGVVMWPLLLIALICASIFIERVWFYRKQKPLGEEAWTRIMDAVRSGKWDRCYEICKGLGFSPAARIVGNIVSAYSAYFLSNPTRAEVPRVEDIVDEALFKETGRLNRFLSTLTTMASVAPLLGLLGTVCGIIETFQVITVVGTGNPRYLSAGISEALVTTQFGLMIAVPVIVAHHFLERWADRLTTEAEEKSSQVCGILTEWEQREKGSWAK
ncbi:MotA/TolQ/ExbB proton channel family protein [Thermodesulforhabdus norvegica]|uniref:Biopolymer transport protein ExbB n=1 Tax=Thermodesulforhabdus norvegica TaxID=39841 RepID=A0A1I4QX43_9BACT|nr:MotA/TolQ/ExbB proton channel family protein [Thermodesulforhabdus norvegica]SFM44581.1 biopolymer transport protein ExbB [Thermodesulforhabdus norvegica]